MQNTYTCAKRLEELQPADLRHLTWFAERRLAHMRVSIAYAEDMMGKALNAVMTGTESATTGRRPRPEDLVTKETFLNYLRGAVSSTVEAFSRRREHRWHHDAFAEEDCPLRANPGDEMLRDLGNELFQRLRQQAPARLQSTIAAWEATFLWADRIPRQSAGNEARDVRMLAAQVIQQLEPDLRPRA